MTRIIAVLCAALCATLLSAEPASAVGGVTFGMSKQTLTNVGDGIEYGLPVIAIGVTALHKDWTGMVQLSVLTAATVGTTYAIRSFVKKTSPDGHDLRSFPSIEASFGSPAEHYLWRRYGWEYGLPAFFLEHLGNYWLDRAGKHNITDGLAVMAISTGLSLFTVTAYHRPIDVGMATADDGTPMLAMRMKFN